PSSERRPRPTCPGSKCSRWADSRAEVARQNGRAGVFDVVDGPKRPPRSARHPLVTGTGHHARMPGTAAERPILVVDDDEKILRLVRMYLERDGYTVREARDGQAALAAIALYEPALVVLDLMLPEIDGLSVLR